MDSQSQPELISFKVCPFVQRSAIILCEKNIAYKTTYVDLKNLPDWFAEISPLGKVPVLKVDDTVVFESAVIAEYLDECYTPSLHPKALLEKAKHRSWTEFASVITMTMFAMLRAEDEKEFDGLKEKLAEQFNQVEKAIDADGPYFAGNHFSLVDAAYAPIFLRLQLAEQLHKFNLFSERVADWSETVLKRESVKHSVVDNFDEIFLEYLRKMGGYLSAEADTARQ